MAALMNGAVSDPFTTMNKESAHGLQRERVQLTKRHGLIRNEDPCQVVVALECIQYRLECGELGLVPCWKSLQAPNVREVVCVYSVMIWPPT